MLASPERCYHGFSGSAKNAMGMKFQLVADSHMQLDGKKGKHKSVLLYRCMFHECPATLRGERSNASDTYALFKSTAETAVTAAAKYTPAGHNAHHERHLPHISVPGEIRALLTHDRLDMPPSRLRSAIRGITLPDGFKVGTLLDARDERAVRLRKGLAKLHKQHLATRRNALMTEGAGNAFGGLSSINYARHRPLGAPTAAGSVRDGEERPRQNSHHRREDDDEDVSRQSRV